jgi:hypothetical protein
MSLPTSITTNPEFVAFNAHVWFAYAVVYTLHSTPVAIVCMIIAAAIKEFWIDHLYEVPQQDFNENLDDFAGYVLGVMLAGLIRSI